MRCPDGSLVTIPDDSGWIPDPARQAVVDAAERPFLAELGAASTNDDVVQYLGLIRSQEHGPSCAGMTGGAMATGVRGHGHAPASGIGPWWDARRRDGRAEVVGGTYLYLIMESLVRRGIETHTDGEETDESKWTRKPSLDDEMDAYDHTVSPLDRRRIADEDAWLLDAIDAALHAGHAVGFGTDVGEGFKRFYGEQVRTLPEHVALGLDVIGTSGAGHAMRIAGKRTRGGRRHYLLQNSWSHWWGLSGWWWWDGAAVLVTFGSDVPPPHAVDLSGCAWVDESVITSPRSRDFQVLTRAP